MNNKWIWILTVAVIVLLVTLFAQTFLNGGTRMMNYSYGWHMPMIYGGGMMGFGMMFLMWLVLLATLVLIGLGIVWLVKTLSAQE